MRHHYTILQNLKMSNRRTVVQHTGVHCWISKCNNCPLSFIERFTDARLLYCRSVLDQDAEILYHRSLWSLRCNAIVQMLTSEYEDAAPIYRRSFLDFRMQTHASLWYSCSLDSMMKHHYAVNQVFLDLRVQDIVQFLNFGSEISKSLTHMLAPTMKRHYTITPLRLYSSESASQCSCALATCSGEISGSSKTQQEANHFEHCAACIFQIERS